jgi:hypothetical protein
MKALVFFFSLVTTVAAAPSEEVFPLLRQVPDQDHYSPREMILAANAFLALGPAKCEASLEDLCRWSDAQKVKDWYQINSRLLLLIRTLYVSDLADPIPLPPMGQPEFPITMSDWQEWPYFPLEFSHGVPLLLPRGYLLAGAPVLAGTYLASCRGKGWLRRARLREPRVEDLQLAVATVVSSRRWRALLWAIVNVGDAANTTFSDEILARRFLYKQCGLEVPNREANQTTEPTAASGRGSS